MKQQQRSGLAPTAVSRTLTWLFILFWDRTSKRVEYISEFQAEMFYFFQPTFWPQVYVYRIFNPEMILIYPSEYSYTVVILLDTQTYLIFDYFFDLFVVTPVEIDYFFQSSIVSTRLWNTILMMLRLGHAVISTLLFCSLKFY